MNEEYTSPASSIDNLIKALQNVLVAKREALSAEEVKTLEEAIIKLEELKTKNKSRDKWETILLVNDIVSYILKFLELSGLF
jgi:hypothetical protein